MNEGEVTHGYNEANINNAMNTISDQYSNFKTKSENWLSDVETAIKACWYGEDCDKFIQLLEEQVRNQNDALQTYFENVNNVLVSLKESWQKFQTNVANGMSVGGSN